MTPGFGCALTASLRSFLTPAYNQGMHPRFVLVPLLLTGQPVFSGASVVEGLRHVTEACADLFGGIKKAQELLSNKKTNFKFGPTMNPYAAAETQGKNITINPNGAFMDTSRFINFEINARRDFIRLTNVEAAAFILAHELGHRSGKLNNDGNDPLGALSVLNNGRIRNACFAEITPVRGPSP